MRKRQTPRHGHDGDAAPPGVQGAASRAGARRRAKAASAGPEPGHGTARRPRRRRAPRQRAAQAVAARALGRPPRALTAPGGRPVAPPRQRLADGRRGAWPRGQAPHERRTEARRNFAWEAATVPRGRWSATAGARPRHGRRADGRLAIGSEAEGLRRNARDGDNGVRHGQEQGSVVGVDDVDAGLRGRHERRRGPHGVGEQMDRPIRRRAEAERETGRGGGAWRTRRRRPTGPTGSGANTRPGSALARRGPSGTATTRRGRP